MKRPTRILSLTIISILALILGAMLILPGLYKDDIYKLVKQKIEQNIEAKVELGDLQISFFKNFPKPSITINDFTISGIDHFEGTELVHIGEAVAQINILSLFNIEEGISITKIGLEDTDIDIRILKDGKTNYDIASTSIPSENYEEEATEESTLNLELKALLIKNINVKYKDEESAISANITNLNTDGFIKIKGNEYLVESISSIEAFSLEYGDITYLNNSKIEASINCLADLDQMKFILEDNAIKINALLLNAAGSVAVNDKSIMSDLTFAAPGNSFGELFSLIPAAFVEDYQDIEFKGAFKLDGSIKGAYYENHYPAITFNLSAEDGYVQYPDLPFPIKDIKAKLKLKKEAGDLDKLNISMPQFSMNLQDQIFGGRFMLKTPLSNPDLDMALNGAIDLHALGKAFPIEDINALEGNLKADFNFTGNYRQVETEAYGDMVVDGTLSLVDFKTLAYDYPPISIERLEANFSPQKVQISDFSTKLGKSDLSGKGQIENLLAYFNPEQTLKGSLQINSGYFYADEWLSDSETTEEQVSETTEDRIEIEEEELTSLPVEKFDFALNASFDQIDYENYSIEDFKTKGHMTYNFLAAENFSAKIEDSDFRSSGIIRNIFGFLLHDEILEGALNLESNRLNLNPFMVSSADIEAKDLEPADTSSYELIVIPKNINLELNAKAKEIIYDKIVLNNFVGSMLINNGQVILDNCATEGLGGSMVISGAYDTFEPKDPGFNFKFDLKNINFSKAFSSLNTYQKIAPIGAYMNGSFNTSLVMDGKMGQDMMPIMDQLNAQGFIHTIAGEIQEFQTLSAIDEKLGLNIFNGIQLKDTKNWFEVKDGSIEVKDFDISYKDIDLTIGGTHSLDQEIDYKIHTKIPSSMYDSGITGSAVDAGYALINAQAGKLGFEVEKAEYINLTIKLSGKSTEPQVDVKLLGAEGKSNDKEIAELLKDDLKKEIDSQVDEIKDSANEELDKLKEKAAAEADKKKSELKDKLAKETDKRKEEAAAEAERILKENLEKTRLDSLLKERNKKAEEAIKKKLEEFNPLKRKKKKDN